MFLLNVFCLAYIVKKKRQLLAAVLPYVKLCFLTLLNQIVLSDVQSVCNDIESTLRNLTNQKPDE